jgi:hypothetical protein
MTSSDNNLDRSAKIRWLGIYLGFALATLVFQIWWRAQQCAGTDACLPSYVKAVVWSAIWPASWAVFLAGVV